MRLGQGVRRGSQVCRSGERLRHEEDWGDLDGSGVTGMAQGHLLSWVLGRAGQAPPPGDLGTSVVAPRPPDRTL